MNRAIAMVVMPLLLASPAFAGHPPANSGVNQLNERGTLGEAPCYGRCASFPSDCSATDTRVECQQAAVPAPNPSPELLNGGYDAPIRHPEAGRNGDPGTANGPNSGD